MKRKLIFVLLDGLSNKQVEVMGYMKALEDFGKAKKRVLLSELPSLSRPLYETLLTGKSPIEHGILNNSISRMSKEENIFSLCKEKGLKTGAAAYYWVSELYNSTPFNKKNDTVVEDENKNIQYAYFYNKDFYPDEDVFCYGDYIRRKHKADFIMIHSMNIDDAGHKYGVDSMEYRDAVRMADKLISDYLDEWIEDGYTVLITSDHGMSHDRGHGGTALDEVEVPIWLINDNSDIDLKEGDRSQKRVATIIKNLLELN